MRFPDQVWAMWAAWIIVLLLVHIQSTDTLPSRISVGGFFNRDDFKQIVAYKYSVDRINQERKLGSTLLYGAAMTLNPKDSSLSAQKQACNFVARDGTMAFFGPQSPRVSPHITSICDALEIPHIETRWDAKSNGHSINLYPHPSSLSKAYLDLVLLYDWQEFCILYEDNDSLVRLHDIIRHTRKKGKQKCVVQIQPGRDFRISLNLIKMREVYNIILDCHSDKILTVLKQAQQIGMMTNMHSYIVTNLDIHLVDLEDFKYGGTNISFFSMLDFKKRSVHMLMQDMNAAKSNYVNQLARYDNVLKTDTALMYDAMQMFILAVQALDASTDIRMEPLDCESEYAWVHGISLINHLKVMKYPDGLTGPVEFDSRGYRTDFNLDILELTSTGPNKIGTWSKSHGVNHTQFAHMLAFGDHIGLQNKTLRVSIAFNDPYIMFAESSEMLTGNARYEGFCIDLLTEIAERLKFNFILMPVEGNGYGSKNKDTGEWGGMIRELLEDRADLAMTDLTISYERQSAVDFTMPFMNLGISIIYMKPQKVPPALFSFMSPLHVHVWIYMMSAYLGVSLLLYILARLSPYEWQNPHPCDPEPDVLENQFTFFNCLWFSMGSLMQQGCDFLPQAVSTRMVAGMWWFFTLIMVSSYTANLAAFLTVEHMMSPIESVEDLAKQTKIKYGTKMSGTTRNFFKENKLELYQKMWAFMDSDHSVFVGSNDDGVDRVKNDKGMYAYFMESTSIEYVTERQCELTQVGGLLDSKSYGIAIPKGSPYKDAFDVVMLKLQSDGRFHILKNKWFRQQRGGGKCKEAAAGGGGASELNLKNVGGVFVVLMSGMAIALFIAIMEFLKECWSIASDSDKPFGDVVREEAVFVFKCKGSSKPVRKKLEETESNADDDLYNTDDYNYTGKNPLT